MIQIWSWRRTLFDPRPSPPFPYRLMPASRRYLAKVSALGGNASPAPLEWFLMDSNNSVIVNFSAPAISLIAQSNAALAFTRDGDKSESGGRVSDFIGGFSA